MLKTQGTKFYDGNKEWRCTEGVVDASALPNAFRTSKTYNKLYGTTGVANNGSETSIPVNDRWQYWCNYFYNCHEDGIQCVELGGHDFQAEETFINAGKEAVLAEIQIALDAAAMYGVKVLLIMGGLSDASTAERGFSIFADNSEVYAKHNELVAYVADGLYGHPAIVGISQLNELDFTTATEKFWKKYFPDNQTRIQAIGVYQEDKYKAVKALQKRPGVLLSFGTAIDSSIYPWDWNAEKSNPDKLKYLAKGCDFLNPHVYLNENYDNHRDVLANQKFPAFQALARALNIPCLIGETGDHWLGGTRDTWIENELKKYPEFSWLWMVRWWDPKVFEILPTYMNRIRYDAETQWNVDHQAGTVPPVEMPVETPTTEELNKKEFLVNQLKADLLRGAQVLKDLAEDLELLKEYLA